MAVYSHELIVVGGGLAGNRAVVEAGLLGVDVGWVSKLYPPRSHSGEAQGGVNAALANHPDGKDDTPDKHAYDTVKGSDFLADQDAVETMTAEAPARIFELEHWGVPFSRFDDGRIAQRPFGGAGFPRTCYGADRTGHFLLHTLFQKYLSMKQHIALYNEFYVVGLLVDAGVCRGVTAINLHTGSMDALVGRAVIFATGGSGRTYGRTTNSLTSTGLGITLPYWAGLPVKDMEFVQFHPTCIIGKHILISEAVRGEGGYLLNAGGERFMKRYAPKFMEISPRDIVARSIQTEINEGRGIGGQDYVHLDVRHLGETKIKERLPGIRDICLDFLGVDPIHQPIPIRPAQHYTMGGIACDQDGRTEVEGFYACGECACVSVHGANRLGGNSLLECVVFGARAGRAAALAVKGKGAPRAGGLAVTAVAAKQRELGELFARGGRENPYEIRDRLHDILDSKVQIFRKRDDLQSAVDEIRELKARFANIRSAGAGSVFNYDRLWMLEIAASLDISEVIALGALNREESRGSHFRTDFPTRDDRTWLTHTIARKTAAGPELSYVPVTVTKWQPEERKY